MRLLVLAGLLFSASAFGATGQPLCGWVTPNTTVCLAPDHTEAWILSTQTSQVARFAVTAAPSASWAGATSYVGVADLAFVSGFGTATELALVVGDNGTEARLLYLSTQGWTPWPGSGEFPVSDAPPPAPAAAGVSN